MEKVTFSKLFLPSSLSFSLPLPLPFTYTISSGTMRVHTGKRRSRAEGWSDECGYEPRWSTGRCGVVGPSCETMGRSHWIFPGTVSFFYPVSFLLLHLLFFSPPLFFLSPCSRPVGRWRRSPSWFGCVCTYLISFLPLLLISFIIIFLIYT